MGKFTDALSRPMEEFEQPPVLPVGHYVMTITKQPDMEEIVSTKNGKTYDKITYLCKTVSASDDVDTDLLAEYGNPAGVVMRKTFIFSQAEEDEASFKQSMFRHRQFLEFAGADQTLPLNEAMTAAVNGQFLGEVTHRPDPANAEIIYMEVGRVLAV